MKLKKTMSILLSTVLAATVLAATVLAATVLAATVLAATVSAEPLSQDEITTKFAKLSGWEAKTTKTEKSPLPGFYQVVADGRVFYMSNTGSHMFSGNLFNIDDGFKNLTEPLVRKSRVDMVEEQGAGYVEYKAPNEKHVVYVFTDPTCGYCQKLHTRLDGYAEKGITIRYIPWPRGGKKLRSGSPNPSYVDISKVMCSVDTKNAMNKLFDKELIDAQPCKDSDIDRYLALGKKLGVSGTPAIFSTTGMMIPGYRDPKGLLKILGG